MAKIEEWARTSKMKFSTAKCQALFMRGKLMSPPNVKLNGEMLRYCSSVKYLGRVLSLFSTMNAYIEHITGKADALFQNVRRVAGKEWGFRTVQLEKLYKGVYLPIVTYAPTTWPS